MSEYLDSTLVYWGWRTPPSEPEPEPDPTQLMIAISVVVATFCVLMAIRQMRLRSVEPPPMELVGVVSGIFVYPLKSARGVAVPEATVTPRGLTNDRLWMAVDANGAFLSQRRAPRLALIEANLPGAAGAALVLHMPGMAALTVHPVDSHAAKRRVRVWDDQFLAIDQGNVPAAWLASALEIEGVRLVRMADDERRECDRKYAPRDQHVAFSDGFPLLLTSEPSLGELNARVAARGKPVVPMDRFRPNLVIRSCDGVERLNPFAEDRWEAISLGDADGASFGVVKPCTRCKIPTIDQMSGQADGAAEGHLGEDDEGGGPAAEAEPTATLRTFRTGEKLGFRKPAWSKEVFFGQNLTVLSPGSTVTVGDLVYAIPRVTPTNF